MAWGTHARAGNGELASSTSGNVLSVINNIGTISLLAGDVIIVAVASDNTSSGDSETSLVSSVTDTNSNTYTKIVEFTNGQTAAATGATVSVWRTTIGADISLPVNNYTVTVNFGSSVSAKGVVWKGFTKGAGNTVSVTTFVTNATDGANAAAQTITSLASNEYLWLHAAAIEGPSTGTCSTSANYLNAGDAAGGAIAIGTGTGGAAAQMSVAFEYRINTATGDTVDMNTSLADIAQVFIALREKSSTPLPNVFDQVTVSESVTLLLNPLLYDVFDTVTVTESVTMNLINMPNVFDEVTVTENVSASVNHNITVSDDVTVTESVTMNLLLQPNVFDTVTVTESVTALLTALVPSVFDEVTVSESVTMNLLLQPIVFDGVTVTESVSLAIALLPNVFDEVTVTEDTTVTLLSGAALEINVNDTVAVADDSTTLLPVLTLAVSDDVTVSESVTVTETGAPEPPAPPADVIRNFSLREWRRWHKPEDERKLAGLGVTPAAAEVIDDVAARQAEDLRLDEQQRTDELFRELELRGLRWKAQYLDLLNAQRQQIIDQEIGERLRLLQSNNERSILLLFSQL